MMSPGEPAPAPDRTPAPAAEPDPEIADKDESVPSPDYDRLERLQSDRDRRRHHATIVSAWRQQQTQDRAMRATYARWLMTVMSLQILGMFVIFILIGCGLLKFEPWTANVFIAAVFAEISALVLLVVKYLFPATTDKILDLIDRFRKGDGPA